MTDEDAVEKEARRLCIEEGFDPDYVATNIGFADPNWRWFEGEAARNLGVDDE